MCSTTRRLLAVLTFGFFGALMAFAVGARIGAAVDGRVQGMTLARSPMPSLHTQVSVAAVQVRLQAPVQARAQAHE